MQNLPLFSDDDFSDDRAAGAGPFTVTTLTIHIRRLLENDETLQDVWVEGEISNLTRAPSGHLYFTLKDANAQLKTVLWKSSAERLRFKPQHGERVLAHGKIAVYEPRGDYQLVASTLQPVGLGDLHQQYELLKARLDAEGLFDAERKRSLPLFPQYIGIVTSPKAAAFQDVLNILSRRYPIASVILSPTLVQGNEAPPQIIAALERLYQRPDIDVILLVRGGGSLEDLWCFNDEQVVRQVAVSPVPIVTGVGHEIDFTLVDFAADQRAPTPSAAAELVTPNAADLRSTLQLWQEHTLATIQSVLADQHHQLGMLQSALRHLSPHNSIANRRQRVDEFSMRLQRGMMMIFRTRAQQLVARQAALQAANPLSILARGYAIVRRTEDGQQVTDAVQADVGTALDIELHRGRLRVSVKDRKLGGDYHD